jgi:hypothetical protein
MEWNINQTDDTDRKLTGEDLNPGDFFTLVDAPEGLFFKDYRGYYCLKDGGVFVAGEGNCLVAGSPVIRLVNITVTGHPENGAST